jgi:hypothetical protein
MFLTAVTVTVMMTMASFSYKTKFSRTIQMGEELMRKPITHITIVKGDQATCGEGYREIFTREWQGLVVGCDTGRAVMSLEDHRNIRTTKNSAKPTCKDYPA